jgi:hypothetical protein
MLTNDFLAEFKCATEAKWRERPISPHIYGFQFQTGTAWNPGLSGDKIAEYENVLDLRFPSDFRTLLRAMNGTNLPTLNIYGNCGEPPREWVGVYSYPRDLEIVRRLIEGVSKDRIELTITLKEQSFDLPVEAGLMPIYSHRYLVCAPIVDSSVVLSIDGSDDAIVYGNSLKEYLEKEFLADPL